GRVGERELWLPGGAAIIGEEHLSALPDPADRPGREAHRVGQLPPRLPRPPAVAGANHLQAARGPGQTPAGPGTEEIHLGERGAQPAVGPVGAAVPRRQHAPPRQRKADLRRGELHLVDAVARVALQAPRAPAVHGGDDAAGDAHMRAQAADGCDCAERGVGQGGRGPRSHRQTAGDSQQRCRPPRRNQPDTANGSGRRIQRWWSSHSKSPYPWAAQWARTSRAYTRSRMPAGYRKSTSQPIGSNPARRNARSEAALPGATWA